MVDLPTFTTKIKQMEVNIPYMDPMGKIFNQCPSFGYMILLIQGTSSIRLEALDDCDHIRLESFLDTNFI